MKNKILIMFVIILCASCTLTKVNQDKTYYNARVTIDGELYSHGVRIIGKLDKPIGEQVKITGRKKTSMGTYILVTKINNKTVEKKILLRVDGISHWPDDLEVTVEGYEEALVRYIYPLDTNVSFGAKFEPHQHLFLSFVITKIIKPINLKIE